MISKRVLFIQGTDVSTTLCYNSNEIQALESGKHGTVQGMA
jgi:hypothetical protein